MEKIAMRTIATEYKMKTTITANPWGDYHVMIAKVSYHVLTDINIPNNLINELKRNFLESHLGDYEEHISDMETRINIKWNDVKKIHSDIFYLEESVLFSTGTKWYLVNTQGQLIYYDDKLREFTWVKNSVDKDGESDYFADVYDYDAIVSNPLEEIIFDHSNR
jgi:hypothetical protein